MSLFITDFVEDIKEFHEKFGFTKRPHGERPSAELMAFRLKFLAEELHELSVSAKYDDLEGMLDALVDLVYVALGTAWLLNLDFEAAWNVVHKANMQKIRAERESDSKRGSTFDVVKPKGWNPPNFTNWMSADDLKLKIDPLKAKHKKQISLFDYLKTLETQN